MPLAARTGLAIAAAAGAAILLATTSSPAAQESAAPRYLFDPTWPRPLPNDWKMGGVTEPAVDRDDNVWVLNRPNHTTDAEAQLAPAVAAFRPTHPPTTPGIVEEIAVDSQRNIYTGKVQNGERVQRFVPAGSARGKRLSQLFARQ